MFTSIRHALCGSSLFGILEAHGPVMFIPSSAPTHLATEARVGAEHGKYLAVLVQVEAEFT